MSRDPGMIVPWPEFKEMYDVMHLLGTVLKPRHSTQAYRYWSRWFRALSFETCGTLYEVAVTAFVKQYGHKRIDALIERAIVEHRLWNNG